MMLMWTVAESGSTASSSSSSSKRPRIDQLPAANLDADDPLDDDVGLDSVFQFALLVICYNILYVCCNIFYYQLNEFE